ncbi:hypothetical protein ONZ51_g11700 [Trametes cubensis]|uniref:DUF6533 domain-containing protein n=1 Tax=Trametes cubensis TaxID=1111947 RepID=A0AAD7X588_9APHY|nr:hypothetical protein ONZ51_g11700 [Trametes cubensis]
MATSTDSALVSVLAFAATYDYCIMSATALLMYYCITTLDEESKHYSECMFTLATLLYATNRYLPLLGTIYFVVAPGLNVLVLISEYLQKMQYSVMAVVIWYHSLNRTVFPTFTTTPSNELPRLTAILVSDFLDDLREATGMIDDGARMRAEETGQNAAESPDPEHGQNGEAASSGGKLEMEGVLKGEAEV